MNHSSRLVHALPLLSAAAWAACSSSTSAPAPTGSITVTITAADGSTPSVVVAGPNAYNKVISTTQTLSGLALGTYTIVADAVVVPDSVVGTITDSGHVTGSPAAVTSGSNAAVTAVYAAKARVGGMWVANNVPATSSPELASNQLRTTGAPVPAGGLTLPLCGPAGLALDGAGNMWVSTYCGDTLLMYTPAARNAGGVTAPTTELHSSALSRAENLSFDSHGNLWVANCNGGNILEFTPAQQAAGGIHVVPAAALSLGATVTCPWSLAFDANGNVWVADETNNQIVEYSAAQLAVAGSSTPTPIGKIGAIGGSLSQTDAVVFDAAGNLWAANGAPPTVVQYTPAQLSVGGALVPNAIVTLPHSTDPFGLAIDNRGTLWVSDHNNGIMYGLTKAQQVTGTPVPAVALTVSVNVGFEPEQPLFDPLATAVSLARVRLPPVAPAGNTRRLNSNRHNQS